MATGARPHGLILHSCVALSRSAFLYHHTAAHTMRGCVEGCAPLRRVASYMLLNSHEVREGGGGAFERRAQ